MSDSTGARASDLERRLATILSADVAEYSRLMAEDEEGTLRTFRGHTEVFEKLVALHRGRIFNTAGDAILAEFGSAVEAVRCATEIQAALRTRNDQLPERRQVQFRIGVNLGDVMVQGHDLLGDGVNVAARLQTAAAPGGICISGSVYDQIRNRLSLGFRPMGDMTFKNIPQAVRTFSIIEAEGLGDLPSPGAARRGGFPHWPVPVAAAAVLLLILAAGGVWLSSNHEQRDGGAAGTATVRPAAVAALAPAPADNRTAAAPAVATVPVDPPPAAVRHSGTDDGVYVGPLCFGATQNLPATCFPVQIKLEQGTFSGQWAGHDQAVTWHLAGDVSASGHVTIRVHGEKADGARLAAVDFGGTLHDGVVDATGEFANGRSATLNWHKREENQTAKPATPAPAPPRPPGAAEPPPAMQAALRSTVEGLYAGEICFGAGPVEGPRCFRAKGTLKQGRLSGEWPGRDAGVTMHLEGEALPSGVVSIRMHADDESGARRATINLTGTVHDGKIDATGNFLNGRGASLNWSRTEVQRR